MAWQLPFCYYCVPLILWPANQRTVDEQHTHDDTNTTSYLPPVAGTADGGFCLRQRNRANAGNGAAANPRIGGGAVAGPAVGVPAEQRAVGSGNAVPRHNCNGASGVRAGWSWVPVYAAQQQPNTLHFTLHRTAHAANG